jgi:hypothetical protein
VRTFWRVVSLNPTLQHIKAVVTVAKSGILYIKSMATLPNEDVLVKGKASKRENKKDSRFLIVPYYGYM